MCSTGAKAPPSKGRGPKPIAASTPARWVILEAEPRLELREAEVEDLVVVDGRVCGVVDSVGAVLPAGAVVLTTGTFLRGEIHLGEERWPAGRAGDRASIGLARACCGAGCG